ncbi:hypothetical protein PAXRUDRAFT_16432 [Paxillus rubicundulus Ve08.2h10]|uniref:Uncharacterized protein n=1 Tax=Paxillus rubicundulus Ve08.2h10 TaxID=930991 RepID=A0A0D0DEE2_9AGAM|nr:hypothetical protein PAXRUDRAFT_16432 [Paxillus rubicundulus Ve08.2h10]
MSFSSPSPMDTDNSNSDIESLISCNGSDSDTSGVDADSEWSSSDSDSDLDDLDGVSISSFNSDDETTTDDSINISLHLQAGVARHVRHVVQKIFVNHYDAPQNVRLSQPPAQLPHILTITKIQCPDHFRSILHVTPSTFDQLVAKLSLDPVFHNNGSYEQQPVEIQLAVTLYQFGHYGNAAGHSSVACWAGLGHGTVSLMTSRVTTAILRPQFMSSTVRFPTAEEKEAAKSWVEAQSCKAW